MPRQSEPALFDLVEVAGDDDDADFLKSMFKVVLWRSKWETYVPFRDLAWDVRRLQREDRVGIPAEPGVYSLLVQPGIANHPAASFLMYIGRADSLKRRFGEYLNRERRRTGRPKIYRALTRYSEYVWFCFARLEGADQATLEKIEDGLLVAYVPALNDKFPAEVSQIVKAFRA